MLRRPYPLGHQSGNQFLLRPRALHRVAGPAEQLQVVFVVRTALRPRYHVVDCQIPNRNNTFEYNYLASYDIIYISIFPSVPHDVPITALYGHETAFRGVASSCS